MNEWMEWIELKMVVTPHQQQQQQQSGTATDSSYCLARFTFFVCASPIRVELTKYTTVNGANEVN